MIEPLACPPVAVADGNGDRAPRMPTDDAALHVSSATLWHRRTHRQLSPLTAYVLDCVVRAPRRRIERRRVLALCRSQFGIGAHTFKVVLARLRRQLTPMNVELRADGTLLVLSGLRAMSDVEFRQRTRPAIRVDPVRGSLHYGGLEVALAPRSAELVSILLDAPAGVASLEEIYVGLFGRLAEREDNTIRAYVSELRKKARPLGLDVVTHRAAGYRLAVAAGAREPDRAIGST